MQDGEQKQRGVGQRQWHVEQQEEHHLATKTQTCLTTRLIDVRLKINPPDLWVTNTQGKQWDMGAPGAKNAQQTKAGGITNTMGGEFEQEGSAATNVT